MTTSVLVVKALLDLAVALAAVSKKDWAGAFLFASFVLVDVASIGVLK